MPDRKHLLAQLQTFSEARFNQVVFLLDVPPAYLPGENAALNTKIIDLIRYAEQSEDGLQGLEQSIYDAPPFSWS